jgi:hypothetical protein
MEGSRESSLVVDPLCGMGRWACPGVSGGSSIWFGAEGLSRGWHAVPMPGSPMRAGLSFFYFDGSVDGGVGVVGALFAGTEPGARVIFSPPGSDTVTQAPPGLRPYRKVKVTAEPVMTWASWEHPLLYTGSGRPADGWDSVFAVADEITQAQSGPMHQAGGNPSPCGARSRRRSPTASSAAAAWARSAGGTRP